MKRHVLASLVVWPLALVGCGSDSPSQEQNHKDAAVDRIDAAAAGADAPGTPDADDAKPEAHDVAAPEADGVVTADSADVPTDTSDAPNPSQDVVEAAKVADARDSAFDADASDDLPIRDTGAPEAAIDAAAAIGFPCRNDADCCIEIDGCMNIAYLYSKAPGAAGPPAISPPAGGMCTACIPPTIEVRCVSGQCLGERVSGYPSALMTSHCGYVTLPDAGLVALEDVIDAGSASTKSVWTCGGN